ncbi:hypothetical protein N8612_00480 [Verrucomicrobia bacterium]|nr:hypothetical protein [Verrucomicrobiota bacterium]
MTLQFNPATQAFVGNVVNTTDEILSQVRVEVHLSNGVELGPTKRTDLDPGETLAIELSAVDQRFTRWVTHPEAGIEEAHGSGDEESDEGHGGEEEGGNEHSEGYEEGSNRPREQSLRPLHNQLQLLLGEMKAFSADLKAKK